MKKYILTIAFLSSLAGYAQQVQNSNWYFGEGAGFHFNGPNLDPTIISTYLSTLDACASYTDQLGQFRFYTNGMTVLRPNGSLIGNTLQGAASNAQGVVVVPRPEHNSVYIVTIDGLSGTGKGLNFAELNLGGTVPGNETLGISIPLRDGSGTPIDSNYHNKSEKLTTAPHCNGRDYWIITQIGQNIFSYLVTPNGITLTPQEISPALVNVQNLDSSGLGQIKISPDNRRAAVCYYQVQSIVGALALGAFDNSDGSITFSSPLVTVEPEEVDSEGNLISTGIYGVEFSPNSEVVYFSVADDIYAGPSGSSTSANVAQITPALIGTGPDSSIPIAYRLCLQRGMNGHIYIANTDEPGNSTVSVIRTPNNMFAPNMEDYAFSFPTSNPKFGFSPWVHWQMGNCIPTYVLTTPNLNLEPYTYRAEESITTQTNYILAANQEINFRAGDFIEMLPNTEIMTGSLFTAEIAQCFGGACQTSFSVQQKMNMDNGSESVQKLEMYPNPSSDYVTLNMADDTITGITVTSLEGKTVFRTSNTTSDFTLDVSSYNKGLYIISVETQNGNLYSKKLIVQ